MLPRQRDSKRSPAAELGAQLAWVVGALASYLVGVGFPRASAYAALATTLAVALLFARVSTGWRAVPAVFAALALLAPVLVALGLDALRGPLEGRQDLHSELGLLGLAAAVPLSIPVGYLLRLERRGFGGLRWVARRTAPVVVLSCIVLAVLGAVRLSRFPTPERYVETLPVVGTIPPPSESPCTPIDNRRDPKHDPGWSDYEECATPEVNVGPVAYHYHVAKADEDTRYHSLHHRTKAGHDRRVALWFSRKKPPELTVRRDEKLDVWLVQDGDEVGVVSLDRWRWRLYLHEIRDRVSPPLSWWLVAMGGLVLALACVGTSLGLRRLVDSHSEARREWVAARQGDLSIIALSVALCTSALLAAALFAGFLV